MKKFFKEFKAFLNQGNLLEVATGLLIATAFKDLVTSFTNSFIMPIINHILELFGNYNKSFLILNIEFVVGDFINSLISFVIILFVLFIIIRFYNRVAKQNKQEQVKETELMVLKEIKELLEKQ